MFVEKHIVKKDGRIIRDVPIIVALTVQTALKQATQENYLKVIIESYFS